jgi:biopolymer transport protein TolR
MLCNHRKPLNPILTLEIGSFPIVMAITVAILLLIYLTIPTPHGGFGLDLPRVDHPIRMSDAGEADAMVVAITRDQRIYFGIEQVSTTQLAHKLREHIAHGGQTKVYIKVDARVPYGRVSEVLDGVRFAGILRIGVLTDERRVPRFVQ